MRSAWGMTLVLILLTVPALGQTAKPLGQVIPGGPGTAGPAPPAAAPATDPIDQLPRRGRIDPFLAVAADPRARVLFTSTHRGLLNQYSYPGFELRASYPLPGPAYHLALDAQRGLLFAVVTEASQLKFAHPSAQPGGPGTLHVYEVADLLAGTGPSTASAPLRPAVVIPLNGNVPRMLASPNGKWIFCLVTSGADSADARLVRVDTSARKADMDLTLAPGTCTFCLTPDGRTLYAIATAPKSSGSGSGRGLPEGLVQSVEAATLTAEHVVRVRGEPCDIQAAGNGLVILSGGKAQHNELLVVDMRKTRSVVARWRGIVYDSCIRLSHDQKRLYVSTRNVAPASVVSWTLPARLSLQPTAGSALWEREALPLGGEIFLTPDGKYLLNRFGAAIALGKTYNPAHDTTRSSSTLTGPLPRPRKLD